jgi:predicted DNA-binding mobile mystery protein A
MSKLDALRRQQIDLNLEDIKPMGSKKPPKDGWIKEIRNALGMSMKDLGARLGVIKQRIERIEKDEVNKKVTIETMSRVAEALNCEFVYFLIPKTSLQNTLESEALQAAKKLANSIEKTMSLEKQGTSKSAQAERIKEIAKELIEKQDRRIWRKK